MHDFETIYARAAARHGPAALEARLPAPADPDALAATTDDRWLSMMTRRIFQAGFVWRVIEDKWAGFEEVFEGFEPAHILEWDDGAWAHVMTDTRIVRNGQKVATIAHNAAFIRDVAAEHGSFGRFVAAWPEDDVTGLWKVLKKRGKRLGGETGPSVLRAMGRPTFLLTGDVCAALVEAGVVQRKPTTIGEIAAVQRAFDTWRAESGRDDSALSIVLACSVGQKR
jgi:3-methyladenine DNA glycosylase Tag